jgi:hypothetical protein
MVGTSNVYVSVTKAANTRHQETYRRPLHSWMLSVEPHHTNIPIPGIHKKDPEPIHYAAARNEETGIYTINTHSIESEPAIIGNILVAESAKTSPEDIHRLLEELLGSGSSSKQNDSSDNDDPEYWIRRALHAMQKQSLAEAFDLEEFMTWARSYEARRIENEAPALVAYPKVHKDHEKKANKHRFWISRPMADRTKTNDRGEALTYGGLM